MRKIKLILIFAALCTSAMAQIKSDTTDLGEYVVTGTRIATPIEKSGKTIYKIDQLKLKNSGGKTVADLLNEVPALQVDGNFSTPGANLEYYVRGARSKYTLVLIDGVPMNDPTGISLFYDLRYLPLNQVESIEILKGGLSTLYGSNAAAGVINIQLKKNSKELIAGSVGVNTGSFGRLGLNASVSGTSNRFDYGLSVSRETFDGFSAADAVDPTANFDEDGFERTNFLFKGGIATSSPFSMDLIAAYDEFIADIDAFAFTDELNAISNNQQFRIGLQPRWDYENGNTQLKFQYINNERVFDNSFPSTFEGENVQLDLFNELELGTFAKAIYGLNVQKLKDNSAEVSNDFTIADPYLSVVFDSEEGMNLHVGLRLNTHSDYENELLTTVNPSFLINLDGGSSLKPFLSISNAYNTPSLFQLYTPFFGNAELSPEKTNNYELGTAFYSKKKLTVNLAFFRRDEQNAIDFISTFDDAGNFIGGSYFNIDVTRQMQGFETDLSWNTTEKLTFTANYSKLATNNDALFARIPKEKYGFSLSYLLDQTSTASLAYNYTGERLASPFGTDTLASYGLLDLSLRKSFLNQKLSAFGAINNLLDEEFVGVVGFSTMGRNYAFGISYDF